MANLGLLVDMLSECLLYDVAAASPPHLTSHISCALESLFFFDTQISLQVMPDCHDNFECGLNWTVVQYMDWGVYEFPFDWRRCKNDSVSRRQPSSKLFCS
jgi:hypothetical protein